MKNLPRKEAEQGVFAERRRAPSSGKEGVTGVHGLQDLEVVQF